jgi:RNA polymerase sigma-70 factor (ECF subfamily)
LFLDEINSASLDAQTRLLQFIQDRRLMRLGGVKAIGVDVRLILASNRPLKEEVAAGRFWQDLYFRVNVFPIPVPPLRERREDIPALAEWFLARHGRALNPDVAGLLPEAMARLITHITHDWTTHERELRAWLRGRLGNPHDAEDLLQDLFLKALRQERKFCQVENARAWLYEVARNALSDRLRLKKHQVDLPDDLSAEADEPVPVDTLAQCLPRALAELPEEDREALTLCGLEGLNQADYARLKGLTLPGAKSRVQRARKRLREHLSTACQVRFDAAGKVCCFVPRTPRG